MMGALLAAVTISAAPSRAQLGETAAVRLRIAASAGPPQLSASVGRIEKLREESPGRWSAEYLPPDESVPQVAILAALAGGEMAWLALPLWGQGDAVVKTRPGARIEVKIGEQRFGPAIADARGTAVVPVDVPPGVGAARHGAKSIDLHVPPTRALHVAVQSGEARADREERVPVLLFAVTTQGAPRTGAQFTVRATRGSSSEPTALEPGVYEAIWTVPPGPPGRAELSAELRDAPGFSAQASLRIVPGPAASIELSADRARVVAGEAGFTARAVARDLAGNPSDEPLRFEASLGAAHAVRAGAGVTEARVEVPPSFGGASELKLAVVPQSRREPVAEVKVALAAADPETARIEAPRWPVPADGVSAVPVRVYLLDRFGNPVDGARPLATAEPGAVRDPIPEGRGAYLATYLPPRSGERADALVAVRAGAALARARIDLLPHIRRLALAPRLGALTNFSGLTSPTAGFEAALRSNLFGRELAAAMDLTYALQNAGGTAAGVVARTHTDWLTLAATVAWRLPLAPGTRAWLGAGPTLTAIFTRTRLAGAPPESGAALVPGAHLSVGVERAFWRGAPFAELRASVTADPGLPNLRGTLRALSLSLGYRFEML